MFKNHPKKDEIQFIVLPIASETMHSTADIGSDIFEIEKEFKDCEIKFNFKLLHQM